MTTYKVLNILDPDNTAIDDTITADDKRYIAMLHELGSVEQKYYIAELNRAATEARRCRNNDIACAKRRELHNDR